MRIPEIGDQVFVIDTCVPSGAGTNQRVLNPVPVTVLGTDGDCIIFGTTTALVVDVIDGPPCPDGSPDESLPYVSTYTNPSETVEGSGCHGDNFTKSTCIPHGPAPGRCRYWIYKNELD